MARNGVAVSYDGDYLGQVSSDGLIIALSGQPVGCVGTYGDVFSKNGSYIGRVLDKTYAYDLDGNLIEVGTPV